MSPESDEPYVDEMIDAEPEIDESGDDSGPKRLDADAILDTFVPAAIDWRDTVRRHPMVSVVGVGLVGYLVGRTKGAAIIAGATAGLSSALTRQLADVFEGDFFDFE
jgi:hypothetical protein